MPLEDPSSTSVYTAKENDKGISQRYLHSRFTALEPPVVLSHDIASPSGRKTNETRRTYHTEYYAKLKKKAFGTRCVKPRHTMLTVIGHTSTVRSHMRGL